MTRPRDIGTEWETRCVNWLRDNGYYEHAERRAQAGALDKGDLLIPGLMAECKAEKRIDLPGYMREVEVQTANCPPSTIGFAWVKARGQSIEKSFVVMRPRTWFDLVLPNG